MLHEGMMIAKNQILKIVIRPDAQNCHPQITWSFSPIQVKTVLLDNQEEVLDDDVAWPDGGPESRPAMRSRLAGSVFGPCTRRAPLHVLVQMKCEFHLQHRWTSRNGFALTVAPPSSCFTGKLSYATARVAFFGLGSVKAFKSTR